MKKAAIILLVLDIICEVIIGCIYIFAGISASIAIANLSPSILIALGVVALVTVAWKIPMAVRINQADKYAAYMYTGFKVLVLLFGNIISGILLLCDND